MNTDRLLAHYEKIAEAHDAIPRLRRFILYLAVRGKLVEQDPNDESASELLTRIRKTRSLKISQRTLKRTKELSPLSGETLGLALPEGWIFSRLGTVYDVRDGTHNTPKYVDHGLPLVTSKNLSKGALSFDDAKMISEADHRHISERSKVDQDDILLAMIGSIGNPVIVETSVEFSIKNIALFKYFDRDLSCPQYLRYFLAFTSGEMKKQASGGLQPFVSLNFLRNYIFSLPPLAEQHRIVSKVDELMALCDRLEEGRIARETTRDRLAAACLARLNSPDPDPSVFQGHVTFALDNLSPLTTRPDQIKALRQTILNLAVRGKLVVQDPNDEPAEELLKRIAAEKARLVKTKRIKKSEVDSVNEEITPFNIPSLWRWTRLGTIGDWGAGSTPSRGNPDLYGGGFTWLKSGELNDNTQLRDSEETVTELAVQKGSFRINRPGDVLIAMYGATIGKLAILAENAITNQAVCGCTPFEGMFNKYLFLFLLSQRENFYAASEGGAQPNIAKVKIVRWPCPLPPLAEQHRIVAKVDELMAFSDSLKANLTTGEDIRCRLLGALLHETLPPSKEQIQKDISTVAPVLSESPEVLTKSTPAGTSPE